MIHDEICTYKVCKLAKEKGFPQHIGDDAYVVENEYDDKYEVGCCYPIPFIPDYLPTITAPTQSLLQRWLREEKGVNMQVIWIEPYNRYYWSLWINDEFRVSEYIDPEQAYSNYELALEDALKYALENLI